MGDERLRFAVAGEDEVHRALGMKLAEAVVEALAHERDAAWIVRGDTWDFASIDPHTDRPPERRFYDIHQAPRNLAGRQRRTMLHGHLDGKPLGGDGRRLRQVVLDHAHAEEPPHLLVILHDTDGREAWFPTVDRIRDWIARTEGLPATAIGTPHRDAEAWFFAVPIREEPERARLREASAVLSFDPTKVPERLTSQPDARRTDAKRVVRFVFLGEGDNLTDQQPSSKAPSPEDADALAERLGEALDRLDRYEACRLADFVADLRRAIPRALGSQLPPTRSP